MPKEQNLVPTERITLSVTPQVVKYLEQLVKTGFYGKNVADAAERILSHVLEERWQQEKIKE
jgi:Arc/MetJ-type ribon-helix-helix transcriptional regulator